LRSRNKTTNARFLSYSTKTAKTLMKQYSNEIYPVHTFSSYSLGGFPLSTLRPSFTTET
jgi:hypothetical protein